MEAGRELDALIAEKVMGWSSQADGLYWDAGNHRTRLVLGSIIAKKRKEMGLENAHGFVFAPSTNIADAWEVVERFRRGCGTKVAACVDVCVTDIPDPCDTYCKICGPDTAEVIAWANEAPLAICLAALKAKGVTGEQHG